MRQLDWIEVRNTRERVAKLLAKPAGRQMGVRVWDLPNGGVLACDARTDGLARWCRTYSWLDDPGEVVVPREVARVWLEHAARDIQL